MGGAEWCHKFVFNYIYYVMKLKILTKHGAIHVTKNKHHGNNVFTTLFIREHSLFYLSTSYVKSHSGAAVGCRKVRAVPPAAGLPVPCISKYHDLWTWASGS